MMRTMQETVLNITLSGVMSVCVCVCTYNIHEYLKLVLCEHIHPPVYIRPVFLCHNDHIWLTWQQTGHVVPPCLMTSLQAPSQAPKKIKDIIFILPLSQTYWSRIQIADANRRWACLKSEEETWKSRRRRRERATDTEIVTSELLPRPLPPHSLMKWSVCALISICGDFGINHRHTDARSILYKVTWRCFTFRMHLWDWQRLAVCSRFMETYKKIQQYDNVFLHTHTVRERTGFQLDNAFGWMLKSTCKHPQNDRLMLIR